MEIPVAARVAFNARGQYVGLATVSMNGEPDLAPVGTAFIRDDGTVVLLQGPLARSYRNLRQDGRAVFMVTDSRLLAWLRFFFTGRYGRSHGWRLHCRLREELDLVEPYVTECLDAKFGGARNTYGGRQIVASLRRALLFDVVDVREVVWRREAAASHDLGA